MIVVVKYPVGREILSDMPLEDRDLLLLAGHALNAVNAWIKILRFSSNNVSDDSLISIGTTYQSSLITRSLYGHIVEISNWLDRGSTRAAIESYLPFINEDSREAYNEIRRRFDTPSENKDSKRSISPILSRLRNKFAFHFPKANELQVAFEYVHEVPDWSLYVSDEHSNSMYWISELVIGIGSLSVTGVTSPADAFKMVLGETIMVSNLVNRFLSGLMPEILKRHLKDIPHDVMHVSDAPDGRQFKLPFYCEGL